MNKFPMLSTAPKGMRKVPSPGAPSDVAMPNVRTPRASKSTRNYGKVDPQPSAAPGLFGGYNDSPPRR